ncbi:hypothetical protein ACC693_37910, partial [Rhizobium ruizarguesonis]
LLGLTYVGLRFLISSDFGRIVLSVTENERRSELLGYDVRRYKLLTFIIGAAVACIAGCLYAKGKDVADPPDEGQGKGEYRQDELDHHLEDFIFI